MTTFKEIKKLIEEIPISSILEEWEPSTLQGKCCFHDDKENGSFKYKDDSKKGGIFTCFACGVQGDKVDFVMKHDGVDFKEANLRIAVKFGKITEEEYKKLSKNPVTQEIVKKEVKQVKKVKEAERHAPWALDMVYRAMKELLGLTEEHKAYLLSRGITETELDNYFSFKKLDGQFFKKMWEEKKIRPQDLIGVPGFYIRNGKLAAVEVTGIGIPLHNYEGDICAIQLRKDKVKDKEARYIYFSSTGMEGGCGCGSPVEIVLPEKDGSIFITEGHFKARELSRHFGVTSISVQGVNNTKALDYEIPELLKMRTIRRFVIAYDADLIYKEGVRKAANKLKIQLEKYDIPVGYMIWDDKYGKGADDVIQNGHADKFSFVKELPEENKKKEEDWMY